MSVPTTSNRNHNRSLRRQQKKLLIGETLNDIEIVETRLSQASTKFEKIAYQNLLDVLTNSYMQLMDSEV